MRQAGAGRKPKPARLVFEAIVYVLRTGCQWKALPAERYGSASAIHARFLEWERAGVFLAIWEAGLAEYDQLERIAWRWQSLDGAMFKAPLGQQSIGANPMDRGKKSSKRHLLVDGRGVPLSLVVTGANAHDVTQVGAVLSAIRVMRVALPQRRSKHLGIANTPFLFYTLPGMAFWLRGRESALILAGALLWTPPGNSSWVLVPVGHFLRWDRLAIEAMRYAMDASARRPIALASQGPPPPPLAAVRWRGNIRALLEKASNLRLR